MFVAAMILADAAQAQRAGDNAVTAAQDAFGTTVGNESIGLYSSSSARGFSPVQAGNVRIEGLYFYQPSAPVSLTGLDSHLSKGSTVRVGLTAQSYPFPAPTGIADFQLRLPGEKQVTSFVASYGPYETYRGELDSQIPVIPQKLGFVVGVSGGLSSYVWGPDSTGWSAAALARWQPTDTLELIPFWSRIENYDWEAAPQVTPAGVYLPPRIKMRAHFYQEWADWETHDNNFGMLGRLLVGSNWTLRTGLFHSQNARPERAFLFFRNMQRDGTSDVYVTRDLPERNVADSGEVRFSGLFAEGPRRHTIRFAARGHIARRRYGGGLPVFLGEQVVGDYHEFPEPTAYPYIPQSRDKTRQGALATGYEGAWDGIGEMSVGVQKVFYRRTFDLPGNPTTTSRSKPWLYNGTLALFATHNLTVYGSYTRGLEESATAPDIASNRGQALPANITEQVDAGIRYVIAPGLRFVAGVFEVKKPYLDRDAANVYTTVGAVKHRGVELSLSGQVAEGLTVVAGAVLLHARVTGFTVDQGLIGKKPAGSTPRNLRLNVQYGPHSWNGLSIDTQVEHRSAQPSNRLNTLINPALTTFNIGGRYEFALFDRPASLRLQVINVTNEFSWTGGGSSGIYTIGDARRYVARFSIDY